MHDTHFTPLTTAGYQTAHILVTTAQERAAATAIAALQDGAHPRPLNATDLGEAFKITVAEFRARPNQHAALQEIVPLLPQNSEAADPIGTYNTVMRTIILTRCTAEDTVNDWDHVGSARQSLATLQDILRAKPNRSAILAHIVAPALDLSIPETERTNTIIQSLRAIATAPAP